MHQAINQVQLLAGDPYRSYDVIIYDVIAGHENIDVNKSPQNQGRAVSVFASSRSFEWYAIWPTWVIYQVRSFDLKFLNWPFGVKTFVCCQVFSSVSMRLDERNTMVLRVFSLLFLVQKLFAKSLIFPKSNIFSLTCHGKVKMWPNVVKSGMVRLSTSRSFRLSLLRSSIAIRGQTSGGGGWLPPGAFSDGEIGGAGTG